MNHSIQIEDLTRTYGQRTVVDNLSLTVAEGEIFGFLGHNGAGKTTTVSMLTTLLQPSSGNAWINGKSILNESMEIRRQIGYLPELVELYADLTVEENLNFLARLSGLSDPRAAVQHTLSVLNFTGWKDTKVRFLSKGMRQKVGLAQAILHKPRVLFLDEPSSGLDPQGTLEMRNILAELNREEGTTIFMNTHMLSEVAQLCTSIGILQNGRLLYAGKMEQVLSLFPEGSSLEQIYLQVMQEGAGV